MFDISEVGSQRDADLLLVESPFPELVHLPCGVLLVALRHQHVLMEEGVSAEANAHPDRAYLVVTVDRGPVVTHEHHDGEVAHAAEKHLILMDDQDVIHETVVVQDSLFEDGSDASSCKVQRFL